MRRSCRPLCAELAYELLVVTTVRRGVRARPWLEARRPRSSRNAWNRGFAAACKSSRRRACPDGICCFSTAMSNRASTISRMWRARTNPGLAGIRPCNGIRVGMRSRPAPRGSGRWPRRLRCLICASEAPHSLPGGDRWRAWSTRSVVVRSRAFRLIGGFDRVLLLRGRRRLVVAVRAAGFSHGGLP